jgi:hypothetical protein
VQQREKPEGWGTLRYLSRKTEIAAHEDGRSPPLAYAIIEVYFGLRISDCRAYLPSLPLLNENDASSLY